MCKLFISNNPYSTIRETLTIQFSYKFNCNIQKQEHLLHSYLLGYSPVKETDYFKQQKHICSCFRSQTITLLVMLYNMSKI